MSIDTTREDRGWILVMNKETMEWEVWQNLGDRGSWKFASLHTSKILADKIRLMIEEDYNRQYSGEI